MRKKHSFIVLLILLVIWQIFIAKNPLSDKELFFRIEKGEGSREIAINLQEQGLIWWGPVFRAYVFLIGISDKLQAGVYQLSHQMSMFRIAQKLSQGDVAKETITIIEGWNLKDIAWYFENKGMFESQELFELNNGSWQAGLEGYLFPDTYIIRRDETLSEIIKKMQNNFDKKLAPYRNEISGTGTDFSNIIIMASLIEKEVRTKKDKEIVSGILWKRLRAGIPLQVDATVIYLTGKKTTKVSQEDTQIDSPYNTYLHYGLPPSPICNPGLESITAALFPEDSQFWYYLSTPEGETVFSETLDEHNVAKVKYLK